ncbi:MAG: FtsX-like permease family protein [Rectinemataceae bacterium]|jgi:putative ABC transport system permease protein
MNSLDMALRNLGRNKRRSLLAILSVAISIFVVIFADGFISGVVDSMIRNATKNDTGHVNVVTEAYRERERFMPASAALKDSDAIIAAIRKTPGLEGKIDKVVARAKFGVILSSASATKAARGLAGDPAAERGLLMLDKALIPGSSYCDQAGTAIVGKKLAEDLGLKVGDTLKVVTEKADYGLGFKKFRISGLFKTGLDVFDDSTFQIGLDDARDLLGLGKGASQVLVMLKDHRDSDAAAKMIAASLAAEGFDKLSARSWTSIGETAQLIQLTGRIYFVIELIIAFLGAFIIANVMMMVVLERKREIGILKSMGMENRRVLGLFLSEGIMLGVIGGIVGTLLGTGLNVLLSIHGMDFSSLTAGTSIPMDNIVRPGLHPMHILGLFCMGVAISAVVAFLPSRSAALMDPIEAIRSV